ncbi:hypothetical protein BGZ90_005165 [Linnemannia elongata]|nr:hypothetical protein BGZ90_005165 [Linnemannia elongata]
MNDEDHFKMLPGLRRFQQAVRKMAVDSGKPFAFRKLGLTFEFRKYYLPLLRNCPDLQEVLFDLPGDHTEVLEVLARCPALRGLDLSYGGYQRTLEREIHRFSQLQTVRFQQQREGGFQFQEVIDSLRSSSQNTLEVMNLCMSAVDPEDVVSIIRSFPNLKEIDVDTFKIYLRDSDRSTLESDVPSANNPSLQVPYLEESRELELPSIRVRFMYPIKAFMSEKEANDYAERSGAWESSESQTLTIEDVSALGFTYLQEIVLYDQNYTCSYEGEPTPFSAIESLLDNIPDLRSLEIDLIRYHYRTSDNYGIFSVALMLAIERHPSLTRLVWHVPTSHVNDDFARCLFCLFLQRPLQELYVLYKEHLPTYCHICDEGCFVRSRNCEPFHMNNNYFKMLPGFLRFQQTVENMAVDSVKPFVFRKLELPYEFGE